MPLLSAICEDMTTGATLVVIIVAGVVDVGDPTVKIKGGLVIPNMVAVMLVVPSATAEAKPLANIVATVVLELAQVTWEVMAEYAVSE
jgi:hypothetical protein